MIYQSEWRVLPTYMIDRITTMGAAVELTFWKEVVALFPSLPDLIEDDRGPTLVVLLHKTVPFPFLQTILPS
uniref:Uncharacterized protein n=1 Tax=Utricularia reniformis TaxID=192314 RepID=A0A1Y0B3D9_9LAMI|nr:hypothetical protein AEK19_MT1725 [Utricularia reniformis]ART31904.1 hypothetical protein AEK19_MT1725 [Utricularia reniformis]